MYSIKGAKQAVDGGVQGHKLGSIWEGVQEPEECRRGGQKLGPSRLLVNAKVT
jgi:hypothetical protein